MLRLFQYWYFPRLGLASSVIGQLDRVWRQNRPSLATKLRIYSTCVLAVGLYGTETWTLLKEDSRRLQASHMTCQRPILGIRWNDFISNRAMADRANLPSIRTRHHSHPSSFHLWPHPLPVGQHTRSHSLLRMPCLESSSSPTADLMD